MIWQEIDFRPMDKRRDSQMRAWGRAENVAIIQPSGSMDGLLDWMGRWKSSRGPEPFRQQLTASQGQVCGHLTLSCPQTLWILCAAAWSRCAHTHASPGLIHPSTSRVSCQVDKSEGNINQYMDKDRPMAWEDHNHETETLMDKHRTPKTLFKCQW